MKTNHLLLGALFLLCHLAGATQQKELQLHLKTASAKPTPRLSLAQVDSFNQRAIRFHDQTTAVLQFEKLPTAEQRAELARYGVTLLNYLPQNAYTVSIAGKLTHGLLQRTGVQYLIELSPKQKMHPALANGQLPSWAVPVVGMIDVQVALDKSFTEADITDAFQEKKISVLSHVWDKYGIQTIRIAANRLEELAALPFIAYVQPAVKKDQTLNYNSRIASRSMVLNTAVTDGGRGLNGEGVVLGIGDNADVQYHVDFSGRLINRTTAGADYHGTHTHGTMAGGGIVREQYRGLAPQATIVSEDFNGILANAPLYVQDYNMVVTNNSYGIVAGCAYNGGYDLYSYLLDQQAFDFPYLQHVFSAGNSGGDNCTPYPPGFHTVLGSYQAAKNVLTVGNADYVGNIATGSSKGPVNDGRLKPEITAMGTSVFSSLPTNSYGSSSGTSMAAPAVSGGLALMYQRYRELHNNSNPQNALMKALLCNGATDKGAPGPDYSYGFGFMNLERSINMLEQEQYQTGSLANGGSATHTITVPANTAQLKVLLYWNDPAPAFVTDKALVNDLDLRVISPTSVTTFPKILNPAPAAVAAAATEGLDHINNIEQVVIDNPAAGTYTLAIQGSVAQNPTQAYYVVYDFVPNETKVVFPTAGTVLTPGEQTYIAWDAAGTAGTFQLDYSTNNGTTWNSIASGIAADVRTYAWTTPAQTSDQVLVRVIRGVSNTSTSLPFRILGTPTLSLAAVQCEGYINLTWSAVTGATDYEVLLLRGSAMQPIATTTATTYSFNSLSKDSTYWVSVRARLNGKPGRRSVAVSRLPATGTCSGTLSNNDVKMDGIVAPVSGRVGTSSELHTTAVKVRIKNLDDAPATGFTVSYQINGGAWVFENVVTSLAAAGTYTHTFSNTEEFSIPGSYSITAVVKNNATDAATANDTLRCVIKQLANAPLQLPFTDNFEATTAATYMTDTMGLDMLDRYDFKPATYGRLRTFINSGVALSGSRSLAVDATRKISGTLPVQYLTGTYNLAAYNAAVNDLRLEFSSINGTDPANAQNRVWIRGSDTQPWVEAYTPIAAGSSASIEIGDLLTAQGQNFSSSFQVRWGVPASGQINMQTSLKGLLLDDVKFYEVFNDLQLLQIDTPQTLTCGLSNAVPVVITLRNSSNNTLTNIPVRYRINNGTWVFENVASIAANTTVQYRFTTMANLAAPGLYNLTADVQYTGDSYSSNNTASVSIYNSATITTFPYLQRFEEDAGGWYTAGSNTSWQWGAPASVNINRAASGINAWKTTLQGHYNDGEYSFLYSPCFAIGGMTKPTISFSVALDLENCGASLCDGAWLEYSVDNKNWYNLADLTNAGTNWYKAPLHAWTIENYTTWHVATMKLPTGYNTIRFRFVLYSDGAVNREGIAVDDIHIYDNIKTIYSGSSLSAPVTQTVSGSNWIHFESGGQLIASVLPNGQTLGNTDVQAYINTSGERFTSNQFYHDRNITIKPTNRNLSAPATVRLYFLESETNALLQATGCVGCAKPASVYDLGISKYSSSNTALENGSVSDNTNNGWTFLPAANVKKVPYDKGYYAEFQVQNFSEFWLSAGSLGAPVVLPVRLLQFSVKRVDNKVLLQWQTEGEQNMQGYAVEVAKGNAAFAHNKFETVGFVNSSEVNAHTYKFEDKEVYKSGVYYYRIKMVEADGAFHYSEVRSVIFSNALTWQVYPNPSVDVFYLLYQAEAGELVTVQIKDLSGKTLKTQMVLGTGLMQKWKADLTGQPAGVYLLQVHYKSTTQLFKLFKSS